MRRNDAQPPVRRSRRLGLTAPQPARTNPEWEQAIPNDFSTSSILERPLIQSSHNQGYFI